MTDGGQTTTLGGHLRAGRETIGLTLADAAVRIEVADVDLAAWENDDNRPGLDRLAKASFVYGLDFAELVTT